MKKRHYFLLVLLFCAAPSIFLILAEKDFVQEVTPGKFSQTVSLDEEGVYTVRVEATGGWEFNGPADISRGSGSWVKSGDYSAQLNQSYQFSSAAVETVELHGYLKKEGGGGSPPEYWAEFNFENCFIKSISPVESEEHVDIFFGESATFKAFENKTSSGGHYQVNSDTKWTLITTKDGGNIPQDLQNGKQASEITVGAGDDYNGPLLPGEYLVKGDWGSTKSDTMTLTVKGFKLDIVGYRRVSGDEVSENDEDYPENLIAPVNDDNDDEKEIVHYDNSDITKGENDDDFIKIVLKGLDEYSNPGSGKLVFEKPADVRIFKGKSLLKDYEVDIANPEGDLAPLASGEDVTVYVECLKPSADATFTYKYIPADDERSSDIKDELHILITRADCDVDSDNDNAHESPECNQEEDDCEYARTTDDILKYPGKIFQVNDNNLDFDDIPDFADGFDRFDDLEDDDGIQIESGDKLPLIPFVVHMPEHLNAENVKFAFEYTVSAPEDVERKEIGRTSDNKPIYEFSAPPGFRIWTRNDGTRNKKSVVNGGDFIPASTSSSSVELTAEQIGLEGKSVTLYIEATPGAESLPDSSCLITLKIYSYNEEVLDDTVRLCPISANLTIDSNNDGKITDADDKVEDKEELLAWFNDDDNSSSDVYDHRVYVSWKGDDSLPWDQSDFKDEKINGVHDLLDFQPLKISMDKEVIKRVYSAGFKLMFYSSRALSTRYFKSSKSLTQDGQMGDSSYLFHERQAKKQATEKIFDEGNGRLKINKEDFDIKGNLWLIFEQEPDFINLDEELFIDLVLVNENYQKISKLDRVKLRYDNICEFFKTYSVRGKQTNSHYETERLKDDDPVRIVFADNYPDSPKLQGGKFVQEDSDKVLVLVHGYNNTSDDANIMFQNVFKKLYRLGFRENMVGYKWDGDQFNYPVVPTAFDPNVENAFESSRGLMNLVHTLNSSGKTVNIAAHSLGNLVALDALRRMALKNSNHYKINNLIHIEAAVWDSVYNLRPAYKEENQLREIEQRSKWDHWCADVPGAVTSGVIINSYNKWDLSLIAMIANDILMPRHRWDEDRSRRDDTYPSTYKEWALLESFRTPNRLSYDIPRNPGDGTSAVPFGTIPLVCAKKKFNASTLEWDDTAHSDFVIKPIYKMKKWYEKAFLHYVK